MAAAHCVSACAPDSTRPIPLLLAAPSHVGLFILAAILRLIFRRRRARPIATSATATEALNFQLTVLIVWIGGIIQSSRSPPSTSDGNGDRSGWIVLPFLVLFALYVGCAVCAIVGAVRAGQRRWWRYPIRIPFARRSTPED